jgi:hypothetical protein
LDTAVTLKYALKKGESKYQWAEEKQQEFSTEPLENIVCCLVVKDICGNKYQQFSFENIAKIGETFGHDNFRFM